MPTINIKGVVCFVLIAGLGLAYRFAKLIKSKKFAKRYCKQLRNYYEEENDELYTILLRGRHKIVEDMKLNGYNDYNEVSYIIKYLTDEFALSGHRDIEDHLDDYIGMLKYQCHELLKNCFNPIVLLLQPVYFLCDIVLDALRSFRIINNDTLYSLSHHKAAKYIKAIVGVVLALFTVFSGWDDFIKFFTDRNNHLNSK